MIPRSRTEVSISEEAYEIALEELSTSGQVFGDPLAILLAREQALELGMDVEEADRIAFSR